MAQSKNFSLYVLLQIRSCRVPKSTIPSKIKQKLKRISPENTFFIQILKSPLVDDSRFDLRWLL